MTSATATAVRAVGWSSFLIFLRAGGWAESYGFGIFAMFYGVAAALRGYLTLRSGYLPRALGLILMLGWHQLSRQEWAGHSRASP